MLRSTKETAQIDKKQVLLKTGYQKVLLHIYLFQEDTMFLTNSLKLDKHSKSASVTGRDSQTTAAYSFYNQ
jgi:hypothetical protein